MTPAAPPATIVAGQDTDAKARERDTSRRVVLIGFQRQANLGIGYLASFLRMHRYTVDVIDCELPHEEIVQAVVRADPVLVGVSLIFQFYLERFGGLVQALRAGGVTCHITMGGHFPSLSYEHALGLVPELDSVVRFEGELTLLELVDRLGTRTDWRSVRGLAYRAVGGTKTTPLRPLIPDLDRLPYPARDRAHALSVLGRHAMPLLASRGCSRSCSFCSIHVFYRSAPGSVVRIRRPAEVVREMRTLHAERGISIFLFQDDDFPLAGRAGRQWASELVQELRGARLVDRVIWKISCRADAVEPELFARMRDAGMYLVYMGLESGTDQGLRTLHKKLTVMQSLRAVERLKELGLMFQFGFMLLDPSSTFESVRDNVGFLRAIVGDGSAAAVFCRMIPYDGTPIRDELARTGRLRGDVCNPDYDFIDPRVGAFYEELDSLVTVEGRVGSYSALSLKLNWAWNEVAVMERLFPALPGMSAYRAGLRSLTRTSNELLFRVIDDVSLAHSDGRPHAWSRGVLANEYECCDDALLGFRNEFVALHEPMLLEALDSATAPA